MKILQILKSDPDADTRDLVASCAEGNESEEIQLFTGEVDYGRLVDRVFECDKVVCWW